MATKIRKVTDFPKAVLNEDLERQAQFDNMDKDGVDDVIDTTPAYGGDTTGIGPTAAIEAIAPERPGVTLGQVLTELGEGDAALSTDPLALENTSTVPCKETPMIFGDAEKAKFQQRAMKQATLASPKAMNIAETPTDRRKQLAEDLKQAMLDMPIPDVTTYVEGRKVTIPSEILSQANTVAKAKAMKILENIVGKELTAQVILCARSCGVAFFQKPHLWLGQRLFYNMSRRNIWDKVELIPGYESPLDDNQKEFIAKGLAVLFSWNVADQFSVIARVRNIELDHAAKILIRQVCDQAIEEKKPKDYSQEYDDTASLEQLIGA